MNYVRFKHFTVSIPASRMSGEMDTSVGNGLMNLLLYLFICHENKCTNVDALVEGDDLIGTFSGPPPTAEAYASLGFNIKIQLYDNANEASFCGLIFDPSDLVSICDPHKVLLNVGWTTSLYENSSNKVKDELLRAKGYSLLSCYAGVPIVQSLALYLLRVTEGRKWRHSISTNHYERKFFTTEVAPRPVGLPTRLLMEKIFKYTYHEQLHLERYFDQKTDISPIVSDIIISHCHKDQLDYDRRFVCSRDIGTSSDPTLTVSPTFFKIQVYITDILSNCDDQAEHEDLPLPKYWLGPSL